MGVYIKGMEMPKDCPMCPLAHWDAADNFTGCNVVSGKKYAMSDHEYANSSVRPDWCPLVFVPPHCDSPVQQTKGRPRILIPTDQFVEQYIEFADRRITAEQAAAALGISRKTFFRWLAETKEADP